MAGQDSFYKTLTPAQSKLAFANEYDFDSPEVYISQDFWGFLTHNSNRPSILTPWLSACEI